MKVVFSTNIDNYKGSNFPDFSIPPRKGDTVQVLDSHIDYFKNRKLPTRLEVVDVVWKENYVICELHYKQIDIEVAKISGVYLF